MAFYDIDLETRIEGTHELRKIKQIINLSKYAYRVKRIETGLGRSVTSTEGCNFTIVK